MPDEVLEAHGRKGDQLGFLEGRGAKDCRATRWTVEAPEVLHACAGLIATVDRLYRKHLPESYTAQLGVVNKIRDDLKFPGTVFSTVTVNKNNRCAAHVDRGNVGAGVAGLTIHGDFVGGYFVLPRFGIPFDVRPGDVLFPDVNQLHGNTEIEGTRVSCVYYARQGLTLCS